VTPHYYYRGDALVLWAERAAHCDRRVPGRGVLRFVFYGRVSTEDWQDPVTSRARQREQAEALVRGHGQIVAELFDVGESRTVAWARRPQAAALVAQLADPARLPVPPRPHQRCGAGPGPAGLLIRADVPTYAFNHQRRLLAEEPGHADKGECESCPVETIGGSTLPAMLRLAERLGADVTPRPVQYARVTMPRIPASNRILPGSGWDISPDDPSMSRPRV
jgi:hypothetical protein